MNRIGFEKKIGYFVLVLFLLISIIYFCCSISFSMFSFVFYGCLFVIFMMLFRRKSFTRNYHKDFIQTVFIVVFVYFIIYYLLGIVVGYAYNVYNTSWRGILSNLVVLVIPFLFREEVRLRFVSNFKSMSSYVFITVIFIICEVLGSTFFSFRTNEDLFLQFVSVFLPIVLENIVLTFLCSMGNRWVVYMYFIPMLISKYFVPVVVDVDWFYSLLLELVLSIALYFSLSQEYQNIVLRRYSRHFEKKSTVFSIVACCCIFFVGLFVAGVFRYRPIAVLSYSMKPVFGRGDTVIVEKLKTNASKSSLKKGDIIAYQLDKSVVIHRIIGKYRKDGKLYYILKGDNNQSRDFYPVEVNQILGKVAFSVPKIGYPSVWLSEFLYPDRDAEVEVGR